MFRSLFLKRHNSALVSNNFIILSGSFKHIRNRQNLILFVRFEIGSIGRQCLKYFHKQMAK
ncbi:conserved hypothetical protein [delta proteobacterium NaphS2]|nr:conserved hypothetical protein [delta proteobacterium NaphS2]